MRGKLWPALPLLGFLSNQHVWAASDLSWHAPNATKINDLDQVLNGSGVYGFIFNSSQTPEKDYGQYNWCNMPHIRKTEYKKAPPEYELQYVEVIHRHHKRTPYADNTFPEESYPWSCSDEGLYYYGQPMHGHESSSVYWKVFESPINPFKVSGFNGTCTFPQITKDGLEDSWQHGRDIHGVYHDLLHFLPDKYDGDKVSFRVTTNVITSQVAGMVINGMFGPDHDVPLNVEPESIDSLEPTYSCPRSDTLFSDAKSDPKSTWAAHLTRTKDLFSTLDSISGVPPDSSDWHVSFDHYFDNLSSRLCHAKPLPCSISDPSKCITQDLADAVFRLGQFEYSYIYRDAKTSLAASVASQGVWIAELAQHIRDQIDGRDGEIVYRHNVAHDGSVSRVLSILQVDVMVWPGMGSEIVFELYRKGQAGRKRADEDTGGYFMRVLFGGKVLRSSVSDLGLLDMIPADKLLAYFDGLVGKKASLVPGLCKEQSSSTA